MNKPTSTPRNESAQDAHQQMTAGIPWALHDLEKRLERKAKAGKLTPAMVAALNQRLVFARQLIDAPL